MGQENLKCKVFKSTITKNGIFKKNSLKVVISTSPMKWEVVRTYEDFKWLHKCIESRFSANYITALPKISAVEISKEADEMFLTEYLNHHLINQNLLFSPELVGFLHLSESEFNRIKQVKCE